MTDNNRFPVEPFTVQADHHRNCDLLIQNIPGKARLRSTLRSNRTVEWEDKDGEMVSTVPTDQANHLSKLPTVPGMLLHVDPKKRMVVIEDPTYSEEGKALLEKLQRAAKQDNRSMPKLRGVKDREAKLDVHQMKTLCREIRWLADAGDVEVKRGAVPKMAAIDEMPGRYLLNPGAVAPNTQPQFEDQMEDYKDNLSRVGA